MVASTRAYSRSGSFVTASNNRRQTSALTRSRKRVNTLFQCPNKGGRSRQGLPVRTTHKTASANRRLSLPLRPGSPGLPRQHGSIFAHWASVRTKRSIRGVNHRPARMRTPESQQALVRKRLRWETGDELRRLVDVECHSPRCPDASELLHQMRADLGLLDEARRLVCLEA